MKKTSENKPHSILNRSNLRDIVVVISLISALFYNVASNEVVTSFLLLAFGCIFHLLTKGVLIRNVVLCRDGTYSIVRHPYYMANYIIDSSFCLLSGNVYLLLAYPFLFYWAYGPTIRKEEGYLASRYGADFFKYTLDIPQIFPDSYSIKNNWKEVVNGFSMKRITRNEISRFARFWATAFAVLFVHSLSIGEFLRAKSVPINPKRGSWEIFLISMVIGLFIFSIIMRRRKNHTDKIPEVTVPSALSTETKE
jgi:protein-S-isoprenylcysteine O-methyltransferase Ste14